jgi:threonine synthase
MDITVSSNFERLLFDMYDRDGAAIAGLMQRFEAGDISLSDTAMAKAHALFTSAHVSDEETCRQIASTWRDCEYLLDPHSAIGVKAALDSDVPPAVPVVSLATAHPAKFPEAIKSAGLDHEVALPPHLSDLLECSERFEVLPNELAAVQAFIATHINT